MAEGNAPVQAPPPHSPRIDPPPPLNVKKGCEDWKLFKQMWTNYCIVARLPVEDTAYTRALFLHTLGQEGLAVYNGLKMRDDPTVEQIMAAFDDHFIGKTNETYERYVFNVRDQGADENIEDYIAALRTLAKTCNFCDCIKDTLLRDRIVLGIRDAGTRKDLLKRADLNLDVCIHTCRAAESTTQKLKSLSVSTVREDDAAACSVNHYKDDRRQRQSSTPLSCKFCSQTHVFKKELCPAWGKTCKRCNKKNHFAIKCTNASTKKRNKIHSIEVCDSDSESDNEQLMAVHSKQNTEHSQKIIKTKMIVQGKPVVCQVDCGASVNIIPARLVKDAVLEETKKNLFVYNGTALKPLGKTDLCVKNPKNGNNYKTEFIVIKENLTPLLGKKLSEDMGLITVNYNNFESISRIEEKPDLILEYNDVFGDGQGSLPGIATFKVEHNAVPVISASCRVPHSMKSKVEAELKKLTENEIILPVEEPTSWCSRMVIATKKSGNLRICIDPRPLNKALKREHYPLPVMEDILPKLSSAKIFSKLDLKNAYWHVHLDEESSLLTTFQTPFGRYRWKRVPFGTSVSSELFQKRLDQALEGLQGIQGVSDDIIIYGDTIEDHDKNLTALLDRCRALGMKLNPEKAELRKKEITFLGHLITSNGLQIDPEKVEAVMKMPKPKDVEDVRRFCGFVNYLSKFLPKLSDVLAPIRQLTCQDVEWMWTPTHDKAFTTVQKLVTEAPVLLFYNPQKPLTIQCDASQSGLGSVLMQDGRPIAYASRALTETETRYAQIEKEMLAIVFSLERFHQYTFGRPVHVESDHKPLEAILQKPLSAAPRRLQGMMLRVQGYDIAVRYKKGKEMYLADALSRAYLNSPSKQEEIELVNMVAFLPIRQERLDKLKRATDDDETLQRLKKVITTGWPEEKQDLPAELTPYFSFRDEISVQDGLIFKGERVIVPISMRHEMKTAVHSTHLGIDGCLKRARECLFWPGMSGDIKHYISSCEVCCTYQSANQAESLIPHDLPSRQWEKVGVDLFELEGQNYLVTVDYFSNFWEIDRLENTTSTTVIKKLKAHFARYGSPCVLISDNGPQFTSEKFMKFSHDFDFEHRTSSPYNSKANGKAESAVKTAKSLLRKNQDEDQFLALLNHRNTPSQATGTSPAQRFLNRRTRTLLPTTQTLLKPKLNTETKEKLILSQKKQKKNYDKRSKDLPPLEEGDTVRLQPFHLGDKKWKKGVVTRRLDERSYEVEADNSLYRRNRVHLRHALIPPSSTAPDPEPVSSPIQKSTTLPSPPEPEPTSGPPRGVHPPGTPMITTAQPCPAPSTTPVGPRRSNREFKPNRSKDFVYLCQ